VPAEIISRQADYSIKVEIVRNDYKSFVRGWSFEGIGVVKSTRENDLPYRQANQ